MLFLRKIVGLQTCLCLKINLFWTKGLYSRKISVRFWTRGNSPHLPQVKQLLSICDLFAFSTNEL